MEIRGTRRQFVLVTALFAGLAALFLHRVLWPPVGQALAGNDIRSLFVPWWTFAREAVGSGRLPLWDLAQFSGYPFLSNPQVALFYLPTWLALILPVRLGISWYVLLHLVIAGVGMFAYVRFVSRSEGGALLAALAFAFSGFMAARIWAGHVGLIAVHSWLPWMLLALVWSVQRKSIWAGILAGLPFALAVLAGHTTSLLYVGLIWAVFGLFLIWTGHSWKLVVRQMALAGGVGLALSAVQLLPLLEFMGASSRAAAPSYEFAAAFSLPPAHLITLLLPEFFGEPTRAGYWSVPSFDELAYYAGVLPLLGLVLALRKPTRLVWFYVALLVIGLLLALGSYGFLHPIVYDLFPPFRLARAPARTAFLYVFAASALLGEGMAIWQRRLPADRAQLAQLLRWTLGVILAAGVAALAATGAVFAAQHPTETSGRLWHQLGGWGLALLFLLAGGALLWRYLTAVQKRPRAWALAGLAALLLADLWIFGFKLVYLGDTAVSPLWTDAQTIIGDELTRVLPWGVSIFEQNGAGQVGLESVFGYNALEIGANIAFASSVPDPRSAAYDILGAGYVIADGKLDNYGDGARPLQLVEQTENVWVYRRGRILPLARLVNQIEVIPDTQQATARVHQPDFDPSTTAILAESVSCESVGDAELGTAIIQEKRSGYWRIRTDSPAPAILVLSETAYPGWQVTIDGEQAEWQKAYTAVRAICVPAGVHLVEWTYAPRYKPGGLISLAGLALVFAAMVKLRREQPRS
ncbi:MAG: hypothetical protein HF973_14695 [Chloroflexi bacterium]|nr:hypothetical protein [Chloroflexota bacterium]